MDRPGLKSRPISEAKANHILLSALRLSQSVGGEADSFPFDSLRVRDDSQKSESNNNGSSRFPEGMTERKATAKATAAAGSLRDDRKKGEGNGNGGSRFPQGMTERKARAVGCVRWYSGPRYE